MGAQLKRQRLRLLIVEAGFESVFSFFRPKTRHVVYLLPANKQRWWSPFKCSLVSTDTTHAVVLKKRERRTKQQLLIGEENSWPNLWLAYCLKH